MVHVPTAAWAHYLFDALAWGAAAIAGWWQHRRWPGETDRLAMRSSPSYFLSLAAGAVVGAWLFGSLNSLRSLVTAPSHSIAGALAGGIFGVELWKWRHGIRESTGGAFVLPICVGLIIGRLGCFFTGLPDFTYGRQTHLPWAVDLGDGVGRHPVQLYEAAAMAAFLAGYLAARLHGRRWAAAHAFHAMIIVYAGQRFAWEFLKPYPPLIGPFNLFHALMAGLIIYGLLWWQRGDDGRIASA